MEKLNHLSRDKVIAYFRFENMVKKEPDFCYLYQENKKCHEMEELNCYLCGCPNFRFNDEGFSNKKGKTLFSYCFINSKDGGVFESKDALHQDCTNCTIPHEEAYIRKHFRRDWFEMMRDVHEIST